MQWWLHCCQSRPDRMVNTSCTVIAAVSGLIAYMDAKPSLHAYNLLGRQALSCGKIGVHLRDILISDHGIDCVHQVCSALLDCDDIPLILCQ